MKVISLTGGIASGKSSAAAWLADQGAHVIDADKLGHRVYEPGTSGFEKVRTTFGDDVVGADGEIDRRALGGKVFGKPAELKKLTDIAWPEIRKLAEQEITKVRDTGTTDVVVLEAAVLFEAGWEDIGDATWVITVARETAIERAVARDGFERGAVESRLDAQLSNDERTARADVVIANDGTPDDLVHALASEWQRLVA